MKKLIGFVMVSVVTFGFQNALAFDTVSENTIGNDWFKCVEEARMTFSKLQELADDIGEPIDIDQIERRQHRQYEGTAEQPGGFLRFECVQERRKKFSVTY